MASHISMLSKLCANVKKSIRKINHYLTMALRIQLLFLLHLAYTLSIYSCHADLGESVDQMILRYGNPVPDKSYFIDHPNEPVGYLFVKAPYVITANFQNGVLSRELISKKDHSAFSDAEIATVLNNNSLANQAWGEPLLLYEAKRWKRADGAIVTYAYGRGRFIIVELHPKEREKNGTSTRPDISS